MSSSSSSSISNNNNNNNQTLVPADPSVKTKIVWRALNCLCSLPPEITRIIFSYMQLDNALRVAGEFRWKNIFSLNPRVHRRNLAALEADLDPNYQLKKDFPKLKIIDRAVWERVFGKERLARYGVTFDDVRSLTDEALVLKNKTRRAAIAALHGLEQKKNPDETDPGITELTLPKGLNLEKLEMLVNEVAINRARFRHGLTRVSQEAKTATVTNTHRVVITNGILQKSDCTHYHQKEALVQDKGGVIPTLLASTTLAMLTRMVSPPNAIIRLFGTGANPVCEGNGLLGYSIRKGFVVLSPHQSDISGCGIMIKESN